MHNRAFTLIELLVVIAIIGILAATVLASLNSARAKARDARRFADLREFQIALDLYYDTHGVYPCGDFATAYGSLDSPLSCDGSGANSPGFLNGSTEGWCAPPQLGLAWQGVLPTNCPEDPLNQWGPPRITYYYQTNSSRQSYLLSTYLESNTGRMADDGGLCNDAYEIGSGLGVFIPDLLGPPGCL